MPSGRDAPVQALHVLATVHPAWLKSYPNREIDGLRQLTATQARAFGEINRALSSLGVLFDALFEQLAPRGAR
jgi:hypothetical protein